MRSLLVYSVALAFVALGAIDLTGGKWRTGLASVLLALVNLLLLN